MEIVPPLEPAYYPGRQVRRLWQGGQVLITASFVSMFISHHVIMSSCHLFILSLCHLLIMSSCQYIIISMYHHVTMSLKMPIPADKSSFCILFQFSTYSRWRLGIPLGIWPPPILYIQSQHIYSTNIFILKYICN